MKNANPTKTHGILMNGVLAISALFMLSTLNSCTKDTVSPENEISTASTENNIYVVHGRLRFNDLETFQQTREHLARSNSQTGIEKWEKGFRFSSLRSKSLLNQESAAAQLMQKFHFPFFYAAMISESGEYQIGDTITWFHDGYKYIAASEEELQLIKLNPSSAKNRSEAGGKVSKPLQETTSNSGSATRTQDSGDPRDARYQYVFSVSDGTLRKTVFETYIYTEYNSGGYGGGFYTTLPKLRTIARLGPGCERR